MTTNNLKIRCPRCGTVYSIENPQNDILKKRAAKCIICESRFFVENRACLGNQEEDSRGNVTFLQSYFEKRRCVARRRVSDRRKDVIAEGLYLTEFPNDIIPIFDTQGNGIIGHISPGRRQGTDRRSGIERRKYLMEQNNAGEELFTGYELDGSRTM